MALLTTAEAKAYRRVMTAAEDALFDSFLVEARALVERAIGTITAVSRTMYGVADPRDYKYRPVEAFYLPLYPVPESGAGAPVITDVNANVVNAATYRVGGRAGRIYALTSADWFGSGPYTVVATAGWSAHPEYATVLEPLINAVMRDYVLDRFDNREPGYSTVSAGGSVQRTQYGAELPPRALKTLGRFRRVKV